MTQEELAKVEEAKYWQDLYSKCQARILCTSDELREWFIKAAKKNELWEFPVMKKPAIPVVKDIIVKRYWKEVENGKDSFCLMSEKQKISVLYPLTTFSEQKNQT